MSHLAVVCRDLRVPDAEAVARFPPDKEALGRHHCAHTLVGTLCGDQCAPLALQVDRQLGGAKLQDHEVVDRQFFLDHEESASGTAHVLKQVLPSPVAGDLKVPPRDVILREHDPVRGSVAAPCDASSANKKHLARHRPLDCMQREAGLDPFGIAEAPQGLNSGIQDPLLRRVDDSKVRPSGLGTELQEHSAVDPAGGKGLRVLAYSKPV
mmetsp:Transcript_24/g.41  ORF Transcript_24/g.41 Transcript_24/m.41 type:complete len:210 (-) Transcript_24:40-669(-)